MKIGDKVTHIGTGNSVYVIQKLYGNIATVLRPVDLWEKDYPKQKHSPITKISICNINNLNKI